MRKFYISLAVIGLVAGYFAKTDFWFEDEQDIYFPITREQLKVNREDHSQILNFEVIKKRLTSQYPKKTIQHSKAYDREVKARLDLLQAMSVFWSAPKTDLKFNPAEAKNFFAQLARDKTENLMIRRQAYKNWLTFQAPAAPGIARLASLANHSDENLIGNLSEDAQ